MLSHEDPKERVTQMVKVIEQTIRINKGKKTCEPNNDLCDRIQHLKTFLRDFEAKEQIGEKGGKVLVVTHSRVLQAMFYSGVDPAIDFFENTVWRINCELVPFK